MNTVEATELVLRGPRDREVVQLPLGLLGFERFKEYLWLESQEEAPFCWLQACDDPALTFLLIPPAAVVSCYEPEISDEDARFLDLSSPDDALLYGVVTLRANGRATVNLKGPIVLNRHTLCGKQIVLTNAADYSLQHPLPSPE